MSHTPSSSNTATASPSILGNSDLLLGLFLCAVSGIALYSIRNLAFGTLTDMGAGFMPRVLAIGLLGFGVYFLALAAFKRAAQSIGPIELRPLLGVALSVGVFALTAGRFGLVVGSILTILVAGAASKESRWRELIIFSVAMSIGAVLLFVKGLALPVPVWPW
ncbi:tripartite tricarboxylate transporter TctB family protein [Pigmentiphaga aceris]|uniref:Tripartite tricarboxylate transporter TctB family protein n=1 Tax=Pigmentiphaga aceris TaxID=1940612 RepID=A0A5C0B377_9BURK|nr:tripartite tricarboxylate transporter TctB family protein [Pigmentiphaga aceris]QEI07067.1 tripartite tricarboxylate transporter TctB family protein [Pigmentiphaga aceris]